MNIAIVQIFTEESFEGFDVPWFMTVGSSLCISMLFSIFTTKLSELFFLFFRFIRKCYDRSCRISYKKIDSNLGEEVVNSKQIRQKDLEKLYTGPQIEAGEKFAQMFNSISICLMYSTGLPMLYCISFLFFFFAYWFDKIMLLRYYQTTFEFNE